MIYANGKGVERNLDLALRFACESGWAPGEFLYRPDRVKEAADAFEQRSTTEVDLSGTGRAAFEIEESARLQDHFIATLDRF
jgi:hypothetical protein